MCYLDSRKEHHIAFYIPVSLFEKINLTHLKHLPFRSSKKIFQKQRVFNVCKSFSKDLKISIILYPNNYIG